MLLDFELSVSKWDRRPAFDKIVSVGPTSVDVLVGTDDPIYRYVSGGTKPHPIRAKRARALHFRGVYRAKTTPGVIASQAGGASGPDVYAKSVMHPGTKPRHFEKQIAKKWRPKFKKLVQAALSEGARASGHALT